MKKRFILLVLALCLLLCLCACSTNDESNDSSDLNGTSTNTPSEAPDNTPTDAPTEAPTDNPSAPAEDGKGIIISGENRYRIIYPEGASKKAALKIYDKLIALDPVAKVTPAYYTLTSDKNAPTDSPEILVGLTNRPESAAAKSSLPSYPDFSITLTDDTIAIYASTEERLAEAVEFFIKELKVTESGDVVYSLDEDYFFAYEGDFKAFTIDGKSLTDYSIIISANASEAEKTFALELSNTFSTFGGKKINILDDSTAPTENEILIGNTNRPESAGASDSNDRMFVKNGKIVLLPATESGHAKLINHLIGKAVLREGKLRSEDISVNSLSNTTVKSITFGALMFTETPNGLQVNKCTEAQIVAWGGHDKTTQASASTGIRLDFNTDSSHFYFKGTETALFELFINGELKGESKDGVIDVNLDNSSGENRVTVLFPCHDANVCIIDVILDDGATVTPHTYDRKFLILGDSITQGKTSSVAHHAYANQISMMFNADSVIQGISGGRFFADTLDPNADFDPDYIFVAFGTNDWSWGRPDEATYVKFMREYFEKLARLYPDAVIFGLAPIWRQDNSPSNVGDFETARQILMDEVEAIGGIAIDCIDFVPHESQYYADSNCLHPNDAGFAHYSKNLYDAVKDYILD